MQSKLLYLFGWQTIYSVDISDGVIKYKNVYDCVIVYILNWQDTWGYFTVSLATAFGIDDYFWFGCLNITQSRVMEYFALYFVVVAMIHQIVDCCTLGVTNSWEMYYMLVTGPSIKLPDQTVKVGF